MLPNYAVHHRMVVGFVVTLTILGGILAYLKMGRLEDPEFTIKTALVITVYPGASAHEVQERVTDVVERAVQRLKGLKNIRSISRPGLSILFVDMNENMKSGKMAQAWQELRYKVGEIRTQLPPETLPSQVRDDFGEVYGIVLALSGDGYSYAQIHDQAREIQKQILLLDQVGRIELWGVQQECIEVEISRARMAELAIPPALIFTALSRQNITSDAGTVTVGDDRIRIAPSGSFQSVEEIGDLVISGSLTGSAANVITSLAHGTSAEGLASRLASAINTGADSTSQQIRLRDIATIRRTYKDPPGQIMRCNGMPAVGIAIAPKPAGNVILMGEQVRNRCDEILAELPAGYKLETVCYQPDNVNVAINTFMKSLYEAIIIVMIVVMVAMGWRSGILITSSLLIVILGTMCVLYPLGVVLQRISLGAFIVALGILVDDAVVVGDLILVRMQRGMAQAQACIEGARRASWQLLGATVVGALAFLPVYLSPDMTGEYCGDLFLVVAISLGISWLVAMLQTPVMYYLFVHEKVQDSEKSDPHGGTVYLYYRRALGWTLHHRTITLFMMLAAVCAALWGFRYVDQIFFPRAQRAQFIVDYWLPEGSSIHAAARDTLEIENYTRTLPGVTGVTTFIGQGPPRFYLPYEPELPNPAYAQLVINVEKNETVSDLLAPLDIWLKEHFPQAQTRASRFALGPTTPTDVEIRISGPDPEILRNLGEKVESILYAEPLAKDVGHNWRQRIPVWEPEYSQNRGQRALTSRANVLFALRWASNGVPVAVYADGDKMLPIFISGTQEERHDLGSLDNTPIWGGHLGSVPLSQITSQCVLKWEDGIIHRRNRIPTITVGANPIIVQWPQLVNAIKDKIEALELPPGYHVEWGGQPEKSHDAQSAVLGKLPIALVMMAIIVVALFNGLRQPLIIMLTFPLAMIGVTAGLILMGKAFGFVALVGVMSLLGMIVRNGVVLMDQIDEELAKGEGPYDAIMDASVERMRPVTVAAMTVVVGMLPLLRDPLFDSMAASIMFGLIVATFLTLFVVPVLYMTFFGIKAP